MEEYLTHLDDLKTHQLYLINLAMEQFIKEVTAKDPEKKSTMASFIPRMKDVCEKVKKVADYRERQTALGNGQDEWFYGENGR